MTIFPLPLSQLLGHWGAYVVFLLIGISFGFVLEMSGLSWRCPALATRRSWRRSFTLKI